MSKYKVHIDKSLPSKEKIERYKNFDSLIGQVKTIHSHQGVKSPIYKNKKIRSMIILILIVILALIFAEKQNDSEKNSKNIKVENTDPHIDRLLEPGE